MPHFPYTIARIFVLLAEYCTETSQVLCSLRRWLLAKPFNHHWKCYVALVTGFLNCINHIPYTYILYPQGGKGFRLRLVIKEPQSLMSSRLLTTATIAIALSTGFRLFVCEMVNDKIKRTWKLSLHARIYRQIDSPPSACDKNAHNAFGTQL
jgi:hypothetical protein